MCIIAIKKKNVKFPEVSTIKTMCDNNPDGFAIVYHITGKGVFSMRSLNSDDVYKTYRNLLRYSYRKVSFFMHARIKTHGTININNCHGWRSDECKSHFAHNGILKIDNRDDMTDSETFLRDIFTPAFVYGGWKAAERTITACIGTSKFVFMDDDGHIRHYGQYVEDNGMLYSNNTYKEDRWAGYYSTCYNSASSNYKPYSGYKTTKIPFVKDDVITPKDEYSKVYVGFGNIAVDKGEKLKVGVVYDYGFYGYRDNGKAVWISHKETEMFKKITVESSKAKDKTMRVNDCVKCNNNIVDETGIDVAQGSKWFIETFYDDVVELLSPDNTEVIYIRSDKFLNNFSK